MSRLVNGSLAKALAATELGDLSERLYQHVLDAIDFESINGLEQMLWSMLPAIGVSDESGDLATAMIRGAIVRAASEPTRYCSFVPPGITKAEEKAVAFDEACPFCVLDAEQPPSHDDGDEPCSLCRDMAQSWREEHADKLRDLVRA